MRNKLDIKRSELIPKDKEFLLNSTKTNFEESINDIFQVINSELLTSDKFVETEYYRFLVDMVAEFTDGFNNDQIGSLFRDALVDHSLNGVLLTPKYFGEKIGFIKAKREARGFNF